MRRDAQDGKRQKERERETVKESESLDIVFLVRRLPGAPIKRILFHLRGAGSLFRFLVGSLSERNHLVYVVKWRSSSSPDARVCTS